MPGISSNLNSSDYIGTPPIIQEINIDDIEGRVCYFSLSGDLALKAYEENALSSINRENKKRHRLKVDVTQRLYMAVVMFDKVVMHCSDPLRSREILEILESHYQWIEEGRILFIFSHHIQNIQQDYRNYIKMKRQEYSEEINAKKEADSLNQEHMSDDYYERVIKILSASKFMVRKSNDPLCFFPNLVKKDLEKAPEIIIVEADSKLSQIPVFKMSLYQLLHAKQLGKDGRSGRPVFPEDIVDGDNGVTESIEACLNQSTPIARSAIVDMLQKGIKKKGKKPTQLQKRFLKAITLRMDILYCKMNCGKQLILEFHPIYENNSIYQADFFKEYVCLITKNDTKKELAYDTINTLLHMDNLHDLRLGFLACMADTIEELNFSSKQEILFHNTFLDIMIYNRILNNPNDF